MRRGVDVVVHRGAAHTRAPSHRSEWERTPRLLAQVALTRAAGAACPPGCQLIGGQIRGHNTRPDPHRPTRRGCTPSPRTCTPGVAPRGRAHTLDEIMGTKARVPTSLRRPSARALPLTSPSTRAADAHPATYPTPPRPGRVRDPSCPSRRATRRRARTVLGIAHAPTDSAGPAWRWTYGNSSASWYQTRKPARARCRRGRGRGSMAGQRRQENPSTRMRPPASARHRRHPRDTSGLWRRHTPTSRKCWRVPSPNPTTSERHLAMIYIIAATSPITNVGSAPTLELGATASKNSGAPTPPSTPPRWRACVLGPPP